MTARWLAVVGIGEDGMAGLSARARNLVDGAEILVGGERHLAMIPPDNRRRLVWPRPLNQLLPRIAQFRGQAVCVVATGDPMYFGIGVTLSRHFLPKKWKWFLPRPLFRWQLQGWGGHLPMSKI